MLFRSCRIYPGLSNYDSRFLPLSIRMAPVPPEIKEVLPSRGALFHEEVSQYILCKPKILPLKSMTLEKVEEMQREAELKAKECIKSASAPPVSQDNDS